MELSDLKYMDLDESQHERYLVRQGDVLFNRTNSADLVGKTAIYRGTEPMAYAGYLIRATALTVHKSPHQMPSSSAFAKICLRS
jgi:type I restriction enzyme S subunit